MLKRIGFAAITALLLLSFGCKSSTTTTTVVTNTAAATTTAKPSTTAAATTAATTTTAKPATTSPAVSTGTLNVVLASLQDEDLNPLTSIAATIAVSSPAFDFLFYREQKTGAFTPGLVSSWTTSADALTVTFNLRKGVQFNEGYGEFTSADVKYMIETLQSDAKFARSAIWKAGIAAIETPDAYTVITKWKTPQLDFIDDLTVGMAFGVPSSKYILAVGAKQASAHPVGTGAYVYDSSAAGSFVKYKAVTTPHWRLGVPAFQYIVIKAAPEEATRVAMLQTGQADLIPISLDSVAAVKKAGLNIIGIPQAYTSYISLGGQLPPDHQYYDAKNPMLNPLVRQALNLAVNKTELVNTIYQGTATATGSVYLVNGWESFAPYPYDPTKAKQLLAQAGFSGFSTELRMNALKADSNIMAAAVAQYWTAIGVNVKLVNQDYATMRASAQTNNTTGWNWDFAYNKRFDWESIFQAMHTSKGGKWSTGINPALESLVASVKGIPDMDSRNKIYTQINQEIYNSYIAVPVVVATETWGASKQVGSWSPPPGMGYTQTFETATRAQ